MAAYEQEHHLTPNGWVSGNRCYVGQVEEPKKEVPSDRVETWTEHTEQAIMKGPDRFLQAYNTQIAVEPDFQLIVGQTVAQGENDKQQMKPLLKTVRRQSGQKPQEVLADSGYCSEKSLQYLVKKRIAGSWLGQTEARVPAGTVPTRTLAAGSHSGRADAAQTGDQGARCTQPGKRSWSRSSDRSNRCAASGSFSYAGYRKYKANGV